jgi:TonB family protein
MKLLSRLLLLCLLGWGGAFAQSIPPTIAASSCEKPEYPSSSKRLSEEGTVQLKFLVGVDGKVVESSVEKSSGFRRLDEAARQSLSKCTFKPGLINGVPAQTWASLKYTWRLDLVNQLPTCQGSQPRFWTNCYGTIKSSIGYEYVGEFIDGKRHGQGAYTYLNGDRYVGQFKDDKFNGQGTFSFSIGDVYEGEFKDGKINGRGTLKFASGNKYVGQFKDEKRSGIGTLYSSNGAIAQDGIWAEDKFISSTPIQQASVANQTVATATTQLNTSPSNLPACQGSYVSSWTNCFGIETNAGGTKFLGEFMSGRKHGRGEYIWENGDKFVGEYSNNKRNGLGIDYLANGQIKDSGTFRDGRLAVAHFIDPKLYPFNSSIVAAATQAPIPDPVKAERDRLAADLEASRKKQQDLEEQLRASQVAVSQNNRPAQMISTERRVALVIGNATYKVNPLKNPVNDSTDMARSLRSVGFDVIEANNTTLVQMREATRRFADKLGNSDVGLVYYSGHGVEVKGKNYLIPVNADIKREYEVVDQAFDASQFLEMMDNIRGPNNKRVNILIVDACRNNELQKSWRSTNNGLARMDAPGGTFISFATAPGRVAADGTGRNSPYTKHLLQALKQPNVPIEQVFKVVRRNVMEETKGEQIPWENSSLVGDFYFTVQR